MLKALSRNCSAGQEEKLITSKDIFFSSYYKTDLALFNVTEDILIRSRDIILLRALDFDKLSVLYKKRSYESYLIRAKI